MEMVLFRRIKRLIQQLSSSAVILNFCVSLLAPLQLWNTFVHVVDECCVNAQYSVALTVRVVAGFPGSHLADADSKSKVLCSGRVHSC